MENEQQQIDDLTDRDQLLTSAILDAGRSSNGGWNKKQFEVLGLSWPPCTGWKHASVNNLYSKEEIELFLAYKDDHLEA